jgi:hypothetical protein
LKCVYGFPDYDITEVTNPMGDEKFADLLQELLEMRNLLLIYRLLHHDDKFPDIKLNLTGREKQLFKPILRIFQNTKTQKELEPVISDYINDKRANNVDSIYAYLFKVITELVKKTNSYLLTNKQIWSNVTSYLEGEFMYGGTTSFMSAEFGKLTQNKITSICREVFGAKPSREPKNRGHIFSKRKLDQLQSLYNLSLEVKVRDMTDMTDMTHSGCVGLDKHLETPTSDKENDNNIEKLENNDNIDKKFEKTIVGRNCDRAKDPKNASYVSEVSSSYSCYLCIKNKKIFETDSKTEYEAHVLAHSGKVLCYPNKADLELHGWEPQGREWEV